MILHSASDDLEMFSPSVSLFRGKERTTMLLKRKSGYDSCYLFLNNLQIILSTTRTNDKFKDKFRFSFFQQKRLQF